MTEEDLIGESFGSTKLSYDYSYGRKDYRTSHFVNCNSISNTSGKKLGEDGWLCRSCTITFEKFMKGGI